jgi:TolB protein
MGFLLRRLSELALGVRIANMERRLILSVAAITVVVVLVACNTEMTGNEVPAPTSPAPIQTSTLPNTGAIVYASIVEASVVASTLDHERTFTFDHDIKTETVISMNCSKDGSRAAYLLQNGMTQDNTVIVDGGGGRQEVPLRGSVVGAALSPDGGRVAITTHLPENGRSVLSLLDVESEQSTAVYNQAASIGPPAWSPDSEKIVFQAPVDGVNQLFVYTLGASGAQQVTNSPQGAYGPAWSPDGSVIVFSSQIEAGGAQLFTVSPTGGDMTQLSATPTYKANPRWSPDGSALAYVGTVVFPAASLLPILSRRHNVGVFTSSANGANETPFTDVFIDAWLLGWCPAGEWIDHGWAERH